MYRWHLSEALKLSGRQRIEMTSAAPSVAQASCYFGYVIAVHRTLLKLGEYLSNSYLRLVSISQTPTQIDRIYLKCDKIDLILQRSNMVRQEKIYQVLHHFNFTQEPSLRSW
jgi:hypothetical protein